MTDKPGRVAWLELNAHKAPAAQAFYRELFCWRFAPLHFDPFGVLPLILNGETEFGVVFTAMGAFAVPRWIVHIAGDVDAAREMAADLGGRAGDAPQEIPGHARQIDITDPAGANFWVIELAERNHPETPNPGDPVTAELWVDDPESLVPFYAALFGLEPRETAAGVALMGDGVPRLYLRRNPYELSPPRWIPYFRSLGVRGDERRAQMLGAVTQVPWEEVDGIGELVVLSDPAHAYFGLVNPDTASD